MSTNDTITGSVTLNVIPPSCSCSGGETIPEQRLDLPEWAIGIIQTQAGPAFKIRSAWNRGDYIGQIRSRVSAFRMSYSVEPGIYAVGNPDNSSDVFVTANYKLSFDILRRSLAGMDAWILVIDTNGINVWCAAGKGTFGTDELCEKIQRFKIEKIVNHGRIILPQLGASGTNADEIKRRTGFRVLYGPVRASDVRSYVASGYLATQAMRTVKFTLFDRLILTPIELNPVAKQIHKILFGIIIIFGLQPNGIIFSEAFARGMPAFVFSISAIVTGAFLTPLLLPYLPFRSFALKGLAAGVVSTILLVWFFGFSSPAERVFSLWSLVTFPALSSFLALQFTGATTFTSVSGVLREIKIAMPFYKISAALSVVFLAIYKIITWGI
jgi:hypothetical protein